MDAACELPTILANPQRKPAVVLACKSDAYFSKSLRALGARPYVMTSSLMAPEAYVLDAILKSWMAGESAESAWKSAGAAYAEYQKTSVAAATRVFVAGKN
jgi:hypothetical protein